MGPNLAFLTLFLSRNFISESDLELKKKSEDGNESGSLWGVEGSYKNT